MAKTATTVGRYLVQRLEEAGLRHVFGIPGDYVLRFYDLLVDSRMQVIGTCTEIGAGFAADAYARVNGLGCVCVTYCVGGLNALNAVAGAFAEKSPLIVITGSPGLSERARSPLLHHRVRDYDTQRRIFEHVTVAAVSLEDPGLAPRQIDETIAACLREKRPVFIEIPRDMVDRPCAAPMPQKREQLRSDPKVKAEAIRETVAMLNAAKNPVILGGVEIHRFGLQKAFVQLVEKTGYPIASTLLGKSVISERHPQYLGIYEGAMGRDTVRRAVEDSDCLLILGAFLTDIDWGGGSPQLRVDRTINASADRISISHHHFEDLTLGDFIDGLRRASLRKRKAVKAGMGVKPFTPRPQQPITVKRFFARMNEYLDANSVVICDIGDSLFGAADLTIYRSTEFISPAYYTSMGFAVPAAVGAQIRNRKLRPIVFVGDGAFQMTGHEITTAAKYGLNPIVFVLNNRGYTTERFIHEGPYNDIHEWAYHLWPQIVREGWGTEVRTEGELEKALVTARNNATGFSLISVSLQKMDRSSALERLGKRLGSRV
jgi:indolepyruvate decarboxylase